MFSPTAHTVNRNSGFEQPLFLNYSYFNHDFIVCYSYDLASKLLKKKHNNSEDQTGFVKSPKVSYFKTSIILNQALENNARLFGNLAQQEAMIETAGHTKHAGPKRLYSIHNNYPKKLV